MKKLFELERDLDAKKEAYHKNVAKMTGPEMTKATAEIKAIVSAISDLILTGAKSHKGQDMLGMKIRPGVFEVGDLASGLRARGETPEEAVANWNDRVFYKKPGDGDSHDASSD